MKSNLITTYLKMMKMLESTYLLPKHDMQVFLRSKPNILNNESALNNPYNVRYNNSNYTLFILTCFAASKKLYILNTRNISISIVCLISNRSEH